MKKTMIIMAVVAFQLASGTLRAGDLRVIYPSEGPAAFIIDKDEILYVEAKDYPLPKGFIPDPPIPPELTNKPQLADIHFKNGTILHVTVSSMENLAMELK